MNKGVKRGLGLAGGVDPSKTIWGGGSPLLGLTNDTGDFLTGYTGFRPIPYYFKISGPATNPSTNAIGIGIDDYRVITQNITSNGIAADNSATVKLWLNPTFTSNVTDFSMAGISVGGFFGYGSANLSAVSLASAGKIFAYGTHLDTAVNLFGSYGLQIHLGSIGATLTEMVGVDLNAMNSIGGTVTNGIFLRAIDGQIQSNTVVNPWNMQLSYAPSQHRGTFGIGGLTNTTLPGTNANANSAGSAAVLDVTALGIQSGGSNAFPDAFAINTIPGVSPVSVSSVTVTAGSQTITSSAAFGSVTTGMYVTGPGIQPGTTVSNVNSSSSILLTLPVTQSGTPTLSFNTIGAFTAAATLNGTTTITSSAAFGSVVVGQFVSGQGINYGTIVTAVGSSSSITVNAAAGLSGSSTLTFYNVSPPRMGYQLVWTQTTSATTAQLYGVTPPAHVVQHYRAKVWARRTGGSSGSAEDAIAFSGDFLVSNNALVGSPASGSALAPVGMATLPGSFTVAASVTTLGSTTVTSTAAFGSVSVGMPITGAGIQPGTFVSAKASSSSITISQPAVATSASVTLTFSNYFVSVTATIYGTVISVNGPATTNVTWHGEIETSGMISN